MELPQLISVKKIRNSCEDFKQVETPSELRDSSSMCFDAYDTEKSITDVLDRRSEHILPPRLPLNFRGTGVKSRGQSVEHPSSISHLAFLLDCFVISFGPDMPQLGRYHPQSNPELYAVKNEDEWDSEWSLTNDDEFPQAATLPWTTYGTSVGLSRLGQSGSQREEGQGDRRSRNAQMPVAFADELELASSGRFNFPDDVIIRELSEMRALLERLLENRDLVEWNAGHNGLREIFSFLPDGNISAKEPSPHFPVGDWGLEECGICLQVQWLYRRSCCSFPACTTCLQQYYSYKVELGLVKIECCNIACSCFVHRDEISARLDHSMKEKFHRLLVLANEDSSTKTCPRCNHITKVDKKTQKKYKELKSSCVDCPACHLKWCFSCHAPWHGPLTCKQFRKGDRLLRNWAKEKNHGQINAQKCPKCKIYIQRTTGCDHMHCTRCKTDFCYKCGDRFRRLKFFGDHYSKLSIFGCKYRFKADRPVQRKAIRGAIFGGKVMAAPILGALALCAGALAVGVGVFALPVYGGVRLYRHCEVRQQAKAVRRQATPVARNVWECYVFMPESEE